MHWLSCSAAHGVFLDQGSNLCLLHWQVNFHLLSYQGNLRLIIFKKQKTWEVFWLLPP